MPVLDRLPRLAERALEGARKAGSAGANAARDLADGVRRRRQAHDRPPAEPASTPAAAPSEPAARPDGATEAAVPEPAIRPAAGEPAPDHVDREAVVVAESHDPGAADGVGAQITVDEPWEGYDELSPQEVVDRLEDADVGKLAVVRLYEQLHRDDRGVLAEIDRRLAALDR